MESPRPSTLPVDFDRCSSQEVDAHRLRQIREQLPGQMIHHRLEAATLRYGQLYSIAEVRQKVGQTLPRRAGFVRGAALEPIGNYRQPIPDEVLLKFDDALRSGLFDEFQVATPTYYQERQVDPWIIGRITGSDRHAVIAQWDV